MPPLRRKVDGQWRRIAHDPRHYTIPADKLAILARSDRDVLWELQQHDGYYQNCDRVTDVVRGGVRWLVLVNREPSWMIEVELSERVPPNIPVVPPEVARAHAPFVVESASGPVAGDFDIYDPVFVGRHTGP